MAFGEGFPGGQAGLYSLLGGAGTGLGFGTRGGRHFLLGKKGQMGQISTLTPEQQQRLSNIMGMGDRLMPGAENLLSGLLSGSPEALQAYQQPAIDQFQQQIAPSIAERFAGMGAGGLSSGAFNRAMTGAGANLATDLAAQRASLQQNALQQVLGLYKDPLNIQAFQPYREQAQPGFLQQVLPMMARAGANYMGGGLG